MRFIRQIGLAALLASGSVTAAEMEVLVVDRITGFPVEGAAVCLGTRVDADKFAGTRTNAEGIAAVRAPAWAHRLTVSGNGYDNINIEQPARSFKIQLELKIEPGKSAPDCRAQPVSKPLSSGIAITDVKVLVSDTSTGRIEVKTQTAGHTATHVRVASRSDFAGSSWQTVQNGRSVHYVRGMDKDVFVQVRRRVGDENNHIEAVSEVVTEQVL